MIKAINDGVTVEWKQVREYNGTKYITYALRDYESKSSYFGNKVKDDNDDNIKIKDVVNVTGHFKERFKKNELDQWDSKGLELVIKTIEKVK